MSRCMFQAPLAEFRDSHDSLEAPQPEPRRPSLQPFLLDPVNQDNCVVEERQDEMQLQTVIRGSGSSGYAMGLTALTGAHEWTVSVCACALKECFYTVFLYVQFGSRLLNCSDLLL